MAEPVRERDFIGRVAATVTATTATCLWIADPDLWGHLRFGLDTLRDRSVTAQDPYSFTADLRWINHEWLSELALAAAYTAAGTSGMLLLKVALVGASFGVMAWSLRRTAQPARWWLMVVGVLAASPIVVTHRPQLWSVLALVIFASTAHQPVRSRLLWWPLVFALWANLHGGWIVGLAVIGAHSLGAIADRRDSKDLWPLIALCALCAAATFATPYGLELWRFMARTVRFGRDIQEWQPLWQARVIRTLAWLLVAATVIVLIRRTAHSWAVLLPVLFLAISSVKVIRLVGLFAVVSVILLGRRLGEERKASSPPLALAMIVALVAIVPAGVVAVRQMQCLAVDADWAPDLAAAGTLDAHARGGRLMVPFDWGQFAIWHFGPQLRVSLDGRRETVYSEGRLAEQVAFDAGDPSILEFIQREQPEYLWLYAAARQRLVQGLLAIGYREDVMTNRSSIFVRSGLPPLRSTPPLAGCFP